MKGLLYMKKTLLITGILIVFAFYIGMAIQTDHPMNQLYDSAIEKINNTHVVNFKSGFVVKVYDENENIINEWQMKRQGIYDAWSDYLHYKNVIRFEYDEDDNQPKEENTSLSFDPTGNMIELPIKEAYFDNKTLFSLDRESETWSSQDMEQFDLLELLPLDAELLNRYATLFDTDNRGKFVVFFFSVDPEYLTKSFSNILESDDFDFPYKFNEGTIKMLVYPDTMLPRRIYSLYLIENLETHEIYEYNLDTYFSDNEDFLENKPTIPYNVIQYR